MVAVPAGDEIVLASLTGGGASRVGEVDVISQVETILEHAWPKGIDDAA
jgi:hypothetical protein